MIPSLDNGLFLFLIEFHHSTCNVFNCIFIGRFTFITGLGKKRKSYHLLPFCLSVNFSNFVKRSQCLYINYQNFGKYIFYRNQKYDNKKYNM